MLNSQPSLNKPAASKAVRALAIAFLVIAILGFFDASYLTVKHFTAGGVQCGVLGGCEQVTTSKYATIGPVPIALFGGAYYLLLFFLVFGFLDFGKKNLMRMAAQLSALGFLVSLVLVYLQFFVIEALCLYCLFSGLVSTLLFILGMTLLYKLRGPINN